MSLIDSPKKKLPFRAAELIVPSEGAKDSRWYIKHYVYDMGRGDLVRRRHYKVPEHQDETKRMKLALVVVENITKLLKSGWHIDNPNKPSESIQTKPKSLKEVLTLCVGLKDGNRPKTQVTYRYHLKNLLTWCSKEKIYAVTDFDITNMRRFCVALKRMGYKERTVDNHVVSLKALFNVALETKLVEVNPVKGVKLRDKSVGKHIAYTQDQIVELFGYMKWQNLDHIAFACKVMYYTLIRSCELGRLQVKEIDAYQKGKLYIPSEKSKNGYERHPQLHPELLELLRERKVHDLPGDWYLFSYAMKPGPVMCNYSNFGKYFRKMVLDRQGYGMEHTLYSWKHTGVVEMHKLNIPDAIIMEHGGWRTYAAFQRYLKSMGLTDNRDYLFKLSLPT